MTEVPATSIAMPIQEASQVGEARRAATSMAARLGFDETGRGRVALVVTEAASNLVKHGGGGLLVLRALAGGPRRGLEVLALDKGAGMADVRRCLADGYSTAGSPGTGLGAIGRLCETYDIDSHPGAGTALLAQLWASPPGPVDSREPMELGALSVPYPGERDCGDSWAACEREGKTLLIVADGLGHGTQAATASREAVRVFLERAGLPPAELIRAIHDALRDTRGAAVAVAEADPARSLVTFAGLGNIAGAVIPPGVGKAQNLVSHNGTAGHEMRKVQEFTYAWTPEAALVLHSDGLATHWRLDRYPRPGVPAPVADRRRPVSRLQPGARRRDRRGPPGGGAGGASP